MLLPPASPETSPDRHIEDTWTQAKGSRMRSPTPFCLRLHDLVMEFIDDYGDEKFMPKVQPGAWRLEQLLHTLLR
ncbi:hypothetical protein MKX03_018781, partial [Papaver bracteatum]